MAIQPQIQVFRQVTPVFSSCAYVVLARGTQEALVIDPGNPVAAGILNLLGSLNVQRVPYIILTHEHFDHIAGVDALRQEFGSRLVCSQQCADAIGDPKANMSFYKDGGGLTCGPADWICERDGWALEWSAGTMRLTATPGHSPGGVCVSIDGHLFTGDTLMGNRRTPVHLPGGNAPELRQSLERIVNEFGPETIVHPGHGTRFALGEADLRTVGGP